MCNIKCIEFIEVNLTIEEVQDKKVLEVGSRNINGSAREYIENLNPSSYTGVDIIQGEGVDEIVSIYDLRKKYGETSFDIIICTEVLEHVENWRLAVLNLKLVLRIGGVILITVPTIGVAYHGWPKDYWRYTEDDLRYIFSDLKPFVVGGNDRTSYIKAERVKYAYSVCEREIYSILRGRRISKVTKFDDNLHSFRNCQAILKRRIRSIIVKVLPRWVKQIIKIRL